MSTYRRFSIVLFSAVFLFALPVFSQDAVYPAKKKPEPATLHNAITIIWEPVVTREWPVLRDLVNAPVDMPSVEPGQCVRFGIFATGDGRDALLEKSTFAIDITSAGTTKRFPAESPAAIKKIKPEGADFGAQALSAAGIAAPNMSMASLAVSKTRWCAPSDSASGPIAVSIRVSDPQKLTALSRTVPLQTFADARKKKSFHNMGEVAGWMQNYHRAPAPSMLLPALRLVSMDEQANNSWNMLQFFVAALRDSPVAAHELLQRLPQEALQVRTIGEVLLVKAGYDEALADASAEKKQTISEFKFPEPFNLTADQDLATRMDMMWSTLFATGDPRAVSSIASMLAWRPDYEAFLEMQKSGKRPTEITESIMRAVCYGAAGWSLNSLSRNDALIADYLDAVAASPETPAEVKSELAKLSTNPAFHRDDSATKKK